MKRMCAGRRGSIGPLWPPLQDIRLGALDILDSSPNCHQDAMAKENIDYKKSQEPSSTSSVRRLNIFWVFQTQHLSVSRISTDLLQIPISHE